MPNTPKQKIVILGDSTIDNKVWLGKEKYHLFLGNRYQWLHSIIDFVAWFNPFKAKSVVENLCAQMPNVDFIDRTNDGFTTTDILQGAYKDKVFGLNTHRFFPHIHFKPLATEAIKNADQIILSVGGNNFREFIQHALQIRNSASRKQYIETQYPVVFEKMRNEYKNILKAIATKNPTAKIILMTQYYPALNQKTLLGTSIYDFMKELGAIRQTGDAQETIVKVMKDTYSDIINFIATDSQLSKRKISIVDVTSSLNPNESNNFVGQIEPSDQGGKKIAAMLAHVVNQSSTKANRIYRFSPSYFTTKGSGSNRYVYEQDITEKSSFSPVSPLTEKQPISLKKFALTLIGGLSVGCLLTLFGVSSWLWLSLVGVVGAGLAWKSANTLEIGSLSTEKQRYQFDVDKKIAISDNKMHRFGYEAAKGWFPYVRSCLPFSGAYCNEDFNNGYIKGFVENHTNETSRKIINAVIDEGAAKITADYKLRK